MHQTTQTLLFLIVSGWFLPPLADAGAPPQAATNAVTAFRYISDPHEFVGGGHNGTLSTTTGALFTVAQNGLSGLVCTVIPNPAVPNADQSHWTLNFYTGNNTAPYLGNYVAYFPETTGITLNVNNLDTDSDIQGDFQVLELVYNPDGSIERLAINFDQYESGATNGLHGQFRYNSTVDLQTEVRVLTTSREMFDGGGIENVYKLVRTGDATQPLTVTFRLSSKDSNGGESKPTLQSVTIPAGRASVKLGFDFTRLPSLPSGFTLTYKLKLQMPADHSYTVPRNKTVKVTIHP